MWPDCGCDLFSLLQFTSSHLSTCGSSTLGASVQSIPDYVYSQLSNPQVASPEAKKLQQDICAVSLRGMTLPPSWRSFVVCFVVRRFSDEAHVCRVAVHASLKGIHEVLTLERERLRQAWTSPDLRQNTSQQLATLCSTLSEVPHGGTQWRPSLRLSVGSVRL